MSETRRTGLFEQRASRIRRGAPYAQRNICGWLARYGVERALADGGLPDPLYGDYRILPNHQVLAMGAAQGRRYQVSLLEAQLKSDSVRRYELAETARYTDGEPVDTRRLALTGADFDGDGKDELAWLAEDGGKVELSLARGGPEGIDVVVTTELPYANVGRLSLLAGVFHDPQDDKPLLPQLLLSWVSKDRTVHLELFTVDGLRPLHVAGTQLGALDDATDRYALAVGDPDAAGLDLVAYGRCTASHARLRLYGVQDKKFVAYPEITLGPAPGRRNLAVTFGDLNGDAGEELAVAWERESGRVTVQLVAVGDDDHVLSPRGRWDDTDPDTLLTGVGCLALTTGYFGAVGDAPAGGALADQLVVGYETAEHHIAVRLFTTDAKLNLGPKFLKASKVIGDGLSYWLLGYDLVLRCGNLLGGAVNAVILGAIGTSRNPFVVLNGYATITIGLLPVAPDLSAIGPFEVTDCHTDDLAQDRAGGFALGLVVADLTGASVVVGKPRMRYQDQVNQVLAVVNAAPLHVVNRDGVDPINVNFDLLSAVSFENSRGEQTELSSELTKDWGYSESLRVIPRTPISEIELSLSRRYGESFSRVSTNTVKAGLQLSKDSLWLEDGVILVTTGYTVWEYDVYDAPGGPSLGQIAVVFPNDLPPLVSTRGSRDILFGYYAGHTIGDALSYRVPTDLPDDYTASRLLGAASLGIGDSASELRVDWESTDTTGTVRESRQSIDVGLRVNANPQFRGFGLGIDVDLEGSYGESEMSSIRTTMVETTTITVKFERLYANQQFSYSVMPIVYWSKRWGYLVVDYLVNIPSDRVYPTAWDTTYREACDLGFSLPWLDGSKGPEYVYLTRDIYLWHDVDTDLINAEVTVTNSSLLAVQQVRVDLYDGPPEGGRLLHTEFLSEVGPRARATFRHGWPTELGLHEIWAVIDPDNKQPDLYRANNTGWSRLLVSDAPGRPR